MTTDDLIIRIQHELNEIRKCGSNPDYELYIEDRITRMQWAINDYKNQDFLDMEPDPFN